MGLAKKGRRGYWGVCLAAALAFCLGVLQADLVAAAPKYLIRWNLDSGPGDTLSVRAEKTKELVEADAELRDLVKIELYYSNSLLKAPDAVEALMRGDIQMSFVGTWYFEKLAPNILILEVPFLFKDLESVNKFFDSREAEAAIYQPLSAKGIKWLAGSPVGTYSLLTRDPVVRVRDLKGMKIRTVGYGANTITALGGVPISLSAADIYIAMQRNTIQGADISAISIMDRRLYEVGKNFLQAPVHFTSDFCIANKAFFESLPETVRNKLNKYVIEGNILKRQVTIAKEKEALTTLMPGKGMKVYAPSDEEMKLWMEASKPSREMLAKRLPDTELIRKVEAMQQ